ncbi:hypothetical protein ABS767_02925 [Sphingomonas sp. ST-64]|uniref:Uncharacterized protein n=1 Tax=Sphingomonas plantiphila TaxID=3163295 RepID=A0ABW8YJ43_9SPHN
MTDKNDIAAPVERKEWTAPTMTTVNTIDATRGTVPIIADTERGDAYYQS